MATKRMKIAATHDVQIPVNAATLGTLNVLIVDLIKQHGVSATIRATVPLLAVKLDVPAPPKPKKPKRLSRPATVGGGSGQSARRARRSRNRHGRTGSRIQRRQLRAGGV